MTEPAEPSTPRSLSERRGPHHAPPGLYERHKALPFGGRLHCNVCEVQGRFEVDPVNAAFGHRPVYVEGRRRDDAKVWASALFIHFTSPA